MKLLYHSARVLRNGVEVPHDGVAIEPNTFQIGGQRYPIDSLRVSGDDVEVEVGPDLYVIRSAPHNGHAED